MSAHTPGPWEFDEESDPCDEIEIIGRPEWPCRLNDRRGRWVVAKTEDLMSDRPEENLANARLIAAAPMLLDGLKIAVARLARVDGGDTMVVSTLLDVIHDATGEAFDHEAFIADEDAKAEGKP